VSYYYGPHVVLSNAEIEVACDALWSVKGWAGWDDDQEHLWERLQPIRTGDYGGSATIELKAEEEAAVVRALRYCADQVELDDDEQRLLARLTVADDAA
jgi:hypothetical protein